MNTKTDTMTAPAELTVKQFCDNHKIPYLIKFMDTILDKDGKPKKMPKDLPMAWTDMNYDECMELNKNKPIRANALIINLNKSDYWVIDIDKKKIIPDIFKQTGNEWYSESFGKKLPHIWRERINEETYSAQQHKEYGLDIITNVLFERLDNKFKNIDDISPPSLKQNDLLIPVQAEKKEKVIMKKKKKVSKPMAVAEEETDIDLPEEITLENKAIMDNIDGKYWSNYNDWIKLIWALYNTYGNMYLCDQYSQRGNGYISIEDVKKYILMDKHKTLSFGTLAYYSKISNEDKYNSIRQKFNKMDASDFGLSRTYLGLIQDELIKHNGELYIYKKPFWLKDDKNNMVMLSIRTVLIKFYRDLKTLFQREQEKVEDTNDPEYEQLEEKIKKVNSIIEKCSTFAKKKAILSEIEVSLEDLDYKMDLLSPDLFAFSCGTIWNVKTKKRVVGEKYDFISLNTGYPWIEPTKEQIQLLIKIIEQIFPNPEIRKSYMSILKQTINGDTFEHFVLFNGSGCNGKGWTIELLKEMLNNYFCKANKDLLVTSQKTGANPELMALDNKRATIFSEPDEGEKIKSDFMKDISGGEKITGRGLYQNAKEINVKCGVKIMECNQRPGISGTNSEALSRRIIDIHFSITLTDNEDKVKKNPGKYMIKNPYYKTDEFKLNHKCALFMLLVGCKHDQLYKPKCVMDRGKEYLMGNDELFTWFNANYKFTEDIKEAISYKCIYENFKDSEFFKTLSGKEKRTEWSKGGLESKIKMNPELEDYWRDQMDKKNKTKGMVMIVSKSGYTDGESSDNDELFNVSEDGLGI